MCNVPTTYLQHIKHNMGITDHILTVLAPYECLGCSAEGNLLCSGCTQELMGQFAPERCHHCYKTSFESRTCLSCENDSNLRSVQAAATYSGIAKELVWKLKFTGAKAAARHMAVLLRSKTLITPETVIVPVPTAAVRVRGRGYDQAKLLARELSRIGRVPYHDCLARTGRTRQVGTTRSQRESQIEGAFRVSKPLSLAGKRILLIDDVMTTGATLEAAARTLCRAGTEKADAAVFCVAER